ncbi:hypothetical protein E6H34_08170 [Candidatus Bathyarchaeota archaeon]|nr:MAG: hypothetical protein E6H34_08170 [Candidatus Bathyarchaeota archaeon]
MNGDENCVFEPDSWLVLCSNICWLKKPLDLLAYSALCARITRVALNEGFRQLLRNRKNVASRIYLAEVGFH